MHVKAFHSNCWFHKKPWKICIIIIMQSKHECARKYKIQKYIFSIFHSAILQLQLLVEFLQFGPYIIHTGTIQSDMTL